MQKTATDLFDEYRRDWAAALNPCLPCLLNECPAGEREALHALIGEHLESAPSPPFSPVQLRRYEEKVAPCVARVMSDPSVVAARDQREAAWRDTPRLLRAWSTVRWRVRLCWWRVRDARRPKPWE